ncbi:MAG: hypothetical protein NXI31_00580 [bacterium]|nr:hypothetical protein [bacterium]
MISKFAMAGLGLLAAASIACVGIQSKYEVLPSDLGGTVAEVGGVNWAGRTIFEFEPQIGLGGFSFGNSGQMSKAQTDNSVASFGSYGVTHVLVPRPGNTWGSWVQSPVGSNDMSYFSY